MKLASTSVALAALLVFGCGGSSSPGGATGSSSGLPGGSDGTVPNATFEGTWVGNYDEPSKVPLDHGTMRIVVASSTISGTFHDAILGDGTVSGTIGQSDFTVANFLFTPTSGVTTYGYLKIDAQGHLIGVVPTTSDQDSHPPEINFDLTKVTSP